METDQVSVERRLRAALEARARSVGRTDLRPPEPPSAGLRRRTPVLRPGRFLPGGTPVVLGAVAVVCLLLVAALVMGRFWWHGPVRPARPPVPAPSEPSPTPSPSADLSPPSPVASGEPTSPSASGTRQLPSGNTTPTPSGPGAPSGSPTGPPPSAP